MAPIAFVMFVSPVGVGFKRTVATPAYDSQARSGGEDLRQRGSINGPQIAQTGLTDRKGGQVENQSRRRENRGAIRHRC